MEPTNNSRPSGIPRPSRLPVPRASVRRSLSRENLQQAPRLNVVNPRLRSAPSREQLSSSTSSRLSHREPAPVAPRDRDSSSGSIGHNATRTSQPYRKVSSNALRKRPSKVVLHEQDSVRPDSTEEGAIQEHGTSTGEDEGGETLSRSRPSLSERTMETLQNIPSSPAVRRRDSNFFNSDSPMRAPSNSSRPNSSHQSDSSMAPPFRSFSSRPSSSSGNEKSIPLDFRASTNTFRPPQATIQSGTPVKRPNTGKLPKTPSSSRSVKPPVSAAIRKVPSANFGDSPPQHPSNTPRAKVSSVKPGSKTLASRPLKTRGSINGLFRKPSMPDFSTDLDTVDFEKGAVASSNTSSDTRSTTSKGSSSTTISPDQEMTPRKSSSALRDQIAKAKAAKRAAASKQQSSISSKNGEEVPIIATGTFDFGLSDDPFNQQINQSGAKGLLRKRIDAARSDGRLNIAAMGFKEIPEEVMNMYNLESTDGSWAEAVDLTRFVAADNEIEALGDDVFPDIDPLELMNDEDSKGNQFGGLETLDLHGNLLKSLPLGFRRLELLTTLNLSNNKLTNECFEVISQIPSLRDLKIAGNGLSGSLDESVTKLQKLEVLDMSRNALTALPSGLADLVRLRILNITENKFTSLPFDALGQLPLSELLAAKNKLAGTLITEGVDELTQLQMLDVTSNALIEISSGPVNLPALHQLSCSSNRLTNLPDLSSWVSLLTLTAEDNNISTIPEGFVKLPRLRNVDLSGNNLKFLDDNIGGMDSLDIFRISGNPLRERKFAGMTTEDLKRALKARMEPVEQMVTVKDTDDGAFYSAQASPISLRSSTADWPVKAGGILDRSDTQSYSLNPVAAAEVAANNVIKTLELHHNSFKEIPSSIAFFAATLTNLSLAHNELTGDTYFTDDLELPALKELNLSSNTFNSLQPLIQRLQAPQLEKLDISFNRLTSLSPLKPHFPKLWTLLASNNTIKELSPESVKGLRVLDCSSNDLNSLNARIGLLGGPGGLERLDVTGNRFRVPKYTVLEKGTEATLTWLRDRIPAGETSPIDVD